jgi:hypothetical protein
MDGRAEELAIDDTNLHALEGMDGDNELSVGLDEEILDGVVSSDTDIEDDYRSIEIVDGDLSWGYNTEMNHDNDDDDMVAMEVN